MYTMPVHCFQLTKSCRHTFSCGCIDYVNGFTCKHILKVAAVSGLWNPAQTCLQINPNPEFQDCTEHENVVPENGGFGRSQSSHHDNHEDAGIISDSNGINLPPLSSPAQQDRRCDPAESCSDQCAASILTHISCTLKVSSSLC